MGQSHFGRVSVEIRWGDRSGAIRFGSMIQLPHARHSLERWMFHQMKCLLNSLILCCVHHYPGNWTFNGTLAMLENGYCGLFGCELCNVSMHLITDGGNSVHSTLQLFMRRHITYFHLHSNYYVPLLLCIMFQLWLNEKSSLKTHIFQEVFALRVLIAWFSLRKWLCENATRGSKGKEIT